jgi:hypothetical protein
MIMTSPSDLTPSYIEMIDTTRPWMVPPDIAATTAAMAYPNGDFAWAATQEARFHRLIRISVTGDPAMAARARGVDVERYDATPAEAPGYIDARRDAGHDDATVYCSRNTLPALFGFLGTRRPRLIIATLDSYPWTPAELAAVIRADYGLVLDPGWIWGIQAYGAEVASGIWWDTTMVYGTRDFTVPSSHGATYAAG